MLISSALETVLQAIGGSALVIAALGSIVSTWIAVRLRNRYDTELENHKAALKQSLEAHRTALLHENEVAVERLRSELSVVTMEHEIRYRRLHGDMASHLHQTYSNLAELYGVAADYVRTYEFEGDVPLSERRARFHEVMRKTRKAFLTHRIFFPKATATLTKEFIDSVWRKVMKFQNRVDRDIAPRAGTLTHDVWHEVSEWVAKEVPPLLAAIEDDYRRLLGHEAPGLEAVGAGGEKGAGDQGAGDQGAG